METAKLIIQQMENGNNRTELIGTEMFSFHDHTGIPQNNQENEAIWELESREQVLCIQMD